MMLWLETTWMVVFGQLAGSWRFLPGRKSASGERLAQPRGILFAAGKNAGDLDGFIVVRHPSIVDFSQLYGVAPAFQGNTHVLRVCGQDNGFDGQAAGIDQSEMHKYSMRLCHSFGGEVHGGFGYELGRVVLPVRKPVDSTTARPRPGP